MERIIFAQTFLYMKLLLITLVLLGLAIAGIGIKLWAKKDGEFDGTCAGSNVRMKAEGITCGCGNEGSCKTNLDNKEPSVSVKSIS